MPPSPQMGAVLNQAVRLKAAGRLQYGPQSLAARLGKALASLALPQSRLKEIHALLTLNKRTQPGQGRAALGVQGGPRTKHHSVSCTLGAPPCFHNKNLCSCRCSASQLSSLTEPRMDWSLQMLAWLPLDPSVSLWDKRMLRHQNRDQTFLEQSGWSGAVEPGGDRTRLPSS